MKILLIAEHDNQQLKPSVYQLLTAASQLGDDITVLIMGANCHTVAEQASTLPLQKHILLADDKVYANALAENSAELIKTIGVNYDYILMAATTTGKNILPRAASLLDMSMLSDVIKIVSADTFVRPIYAGNVLATVQSSDKIKLMTIRTPAFAAAKVDSDKKTSIEKLSFVFDHPTSKVEKEELSHSVRPELTAAKVIISGGRGLKSAENFKLLEKVADRLGAAVGASRAAVDAGYVPNDYQVGQTGKIVAPDLYIAVGISGAIQHLAGMKDSKVIVAINNDPEAPIFEVADYALVGDLFQILPELEKALA